MGKKIDLVGKRVGRLVVLEKVEEKRINNSSIWLCKCDCGTIREYQTRALTSKQHYKSCGCLIPERAKEASTTHGMCKTRLHKIWTNMKQRCSNPNSDSYHLYGERGIKVCDEWLTFEPFKEWSLENGYKSNLTLDRIDNNGNYNPSNCRWTTHSRQMRNTRRSVYLTYNNKTLPLLDWCEIKGAKPGAVRYRVRKGFPEEFWFLSSFEFRKRIKEMRP
jgi:hypothetical protein